MDALEQLYAEHARLTTEYETVEAAFIRAKQSGNAQAERILRGHCAYLLGQMAGIGKAVILFQP